METAATFSINWPSLARLTAKQWTMIALGSLAFTAYHIIAAGHRRKEEYRVALGRQNKARIAFQNGQYPLAIAQGKLALLTFEEQLPPEHPLLLEMKHELIRSCKAANDMALAGELVKNAFRRVVKIGPDNRLPAALLAASCSLILALQDQTAEAITGYEKALELLGKDSEHYTAIQSELEAVRSRR